MRLAAQMFFTSFYLLFYSTTLGGSPGKTGGAPAMVWQLCLSRSTQAETDCHICYPVNSELAAFAVMIILAAIPAVRKFLKKGEAAPP